VLLAYLVERLALLVGDIDLVVPLVSVEIVGAALMLEEVMVLLTEFVAVDVLDAGVMHGQKRDAVAASGTRAQREVPLPPFHKHVSPERIGKSSSTNGFSMFGHNPASICAKMSRNSPSD
jgi:hypothetical protein